MDNPPREPADDPIRPEHYEVLDSQGRPVKHPPRQPVGRFPAVSVSILATCILVFIAVNVVGATLFNKPEYLYYLTFSPGHGMILPGLFTHMFAHADILHLLFNMLMLYFLGTMVEQLYGPGRYGVLYLAAGVFAALAQAAVNPDGLLLGASGALAGVMAAFVRHYPHVRLYIWGILPIPAWLAAVLWIGYNIVGTQHSGAGVAFMAHLAGFLAGMVISLVLYPPRARKPGKPVQ